jgi:hypothetical protein
MPAPSRLLATNSRVPRSKPTSTVSSPPSRADTIGADDVSVTGQLTRSDPNLAKSATVLSRRRRLARARVGSGTSARRPQRLDWLAMRSSYQPDPRMTGATIRHNRNQRSTDRRRACSALCTHRHGPEATIVWRELIASACQMIVSRACLAIDRCASCIRPARTPIRLASCDGSHKEINQEGS